MLRKAALGDIQGGGAIRSCAVCGRISAASPRPSRDDDHARVSRMPVPGRASSKT